jgi:long-chain acyl-CoA synthetase
MDPTLANVADLVTAAARRGADHPAIIDGASGARVSWAELDAAVDAGAAALLAAGLAPGDRVVLRLPTSLALCGGVFAVLRAGGVAVPVAADLPDLALQTVLSDSGATLLLDAEHQGPQQIGGPKAVQARRPRGGADLAVLAYTSGTSAKPRGVMLSHRALLANVAQCAALRPAPVTAADRVLLALPLYHAYGLGCGLLQTAWAGATAVLMERFTAEDALRVIEEHRVTTVAGVPPMFAALLELDRERLRSGLATVRLLTSGAAPLDPAVLAGFRAATGHPIFEGYGLTETAPVLTSNLVGGAVKPGSVGRPLPGIELRLVDADGSPMTVDESEPEDDEEDAGTGLVAVRGANLFSGYWPDGQHGPDADGWFVTGDVGYLDSDGDLHLVDRANDLIIVNGFNVYPHEVEAVLALLDEVADAAVVGVPNTRTGEAVRAVLLLRAGAQLTAARVIEHCTDRLARFKVPTIVEFAETLPYSITGKVSRSRLRSA